MVALQPPSLPVLNWPFLDLLRQLDSANGDSRVFESFEPQHRSNSLFDSPVVLFNEVVQVLTRSDSHSFGNRLHFPHRAMRCRIGIQRDLRWLARFLYRIAEKSLLQHSRRDFGSRRNRRSGLPCPHPDTGRPSVRQPLYMSFLKGPPTGRAYRPQRFSNSGR